MIIYTGIIAVLFLLGAYDDNIKSRFSLLDYSLLVPIFGRIFGWW